MKPRCSIFAALLLALGFSANCSKTSSNEVVVYSSVEEEYSSLIFKDFEQATGIRVKPVYDVEATKSAGLTNRLIAEKENPKADVFWSGEPLRIFELKERGVLKPYDSPSAADIPAQFKDPEHYWTGFGGRLRVIIYNRDLVKPEDAPTSICDFANPRFAGKCAIANPLFGTTTFHFVSLFAMLGQERALDLFQKMKANRVRIVDGNSVVRRLVESGEIEIGLTDSDDADLAVASGKHVGIVYPDADALGALVMPNMVGLIKSGPHENSGKEFIDYLLGKASDEKLVAAHWTKIPIRNLKGDFANGIKINIPEYRCVADLAPSSLAEIKHILAL